MLVGISIMIAGVGFQSMLADTADEHEWLFGVRREGLFFSGLTLDAIQFPTGLAAKGAALEIPDGVVRQLGLISGPLPAALVAVAPLFLLGYHLTRKRHAEIIAGLAARHAKG